MGRTVALFRGINLAGKNRLSMANLRAVAEQIGCTDVATYVQSGNLIVSSSLSAPKLGEQLTAALKKETGRGIAVVTRTAKEWKAIIAANPFPEISDGTKLHVTFLAKPAGAAVKRLDAEPFAPEEFVVSGRQLYLSLPDGIGRSKLAAELTKATGSDVATTRNWRTVLEIGRLLGESGR